MKPISSRPLSILFVDDEPMVVKGLARNVGSLEAGWETRLAASAAEALALLEREPFDVVVSDLRMPQMDGSQLLEKVRSRYPHTIRFVLSGYAKEDLMLKATGTAHRYLAKPCDTAELVQAIAQAKRTQKLLANAEVVRFVNETSELHADNKPLQEILDATNDPQGDLDEVSSVISRNPTVHVAILRMANTAYFGVGGDIETIDEALQRLGLELVRGLAIIELSRSRLRLPESQKALMDAALKHSVACSGVTRRMRSFVRDAKLLQALGSAALLHDLGKLVLLARKGEDYAALCARSAAERAPLWQLERRAYGCDHAAIGGYLLQLWGFPEAIIRGVAGHHQPLKLASRELCPVSLQHLANVACHRLYPTAAYCGGDADPELLRRLKVNPAFPAGLDGN